MTLTWEYNKADWPWTCLFFAFCFCLTFQLPPTKQKRQKLPPHPSRLLSAASLLRPLPPLPCPFPPLPFPLARALGRLCMCIWTLCGGRSLAGVHNKENPFTVLSDWFRPSWAHPVAWPIGSPCPFADDPFQQAPNFGPLLRSCLLACAWQLGLDFVVNTFGRLFLNMIAWYFPGVNSKGQ